MLPESSQKTCRYPNYIPVLAGAASGFVSRCICAPLDLIKIRLQLRPLQTLPPPAPGPASSQAPPYLAPSTAKFRSVATGRNVVRSEGGVRGLFKGNFMGILLWVGYSAVSFGVVDGVRKGLGAPGPATSFIAGSTAGLIATSITYPFDIARTTLASSPSLFTSNQPTTLRSFLRFTMDRKGIRGIYAGLGAAQLSIVPAMGVNFMLYDLGVKFLGNKRTQGLGLGLGAKENTMDILRSLFAGGFSGAASKIVVYPLDTCKKRMQASSFTSAVAVESTGVAGTLRLIVRQEGIRGLYRGIGPTLLKSAVGTGVTFAVYRGVEGALKGQYFEDGHDHDGGGKGVVYSGNGNGNGNGEKATKLN